MQRGRCIHTTNLKQIMSFDFIEYSSMTPECQYPLFHALYTCIGKGDCTKLKLKLKF